MFLGIDVGTTSVKAVLINDAGQAVAAASSGYALDTPFPGWAEQDPVTWWEATLKALRQLGEAGHELYRVTGVGLTGQMHGCVLLTADGQVVRPALLWCDQRTGDEARYIEERLGRDNLLQYTGNVSLPGFTLSKLLWVRKHEPEQFARARTLLLPKDYIRYRLTGDLATDVSDASGTLLFDVRQRKWSREMADSFAIDSSLLPPAYESVTGTGRIEGAVSRVTGLPAGTPVFAGAGDQAAGAVGCGAVRRGIASVALGTSGVVFATGDAYPEPPDPGLHNFCHAVPGSWHVMGVILSAGFSLSWWAQLLTEAGASGDGAPDGLFGFLDRAAAAVPAGSAGLIFLPYLMGERTPYADPRARGAFVGLTPAHGAGHLARAVMEGVAFALYQSLKKISDGGIVLDEVRVTGGGARLETWRGILADVFGLPVQIPSTPEGPAFGAALLAAVGCGAYNSVPEACARIGTREVARPQLDNRERYSRYYPFYDRLYGQLRDTMHSLSRDAGDGSALNKI